MHTFSALLPIVLALTLMLVFKQRSGRSLLSSWALAALLCLTVWKMPTVIYCTVATGIAYFLAR